MKLKRRKGSAVLRSWVSSIGGLLTTWVARAAIQSIQPLVPSVSKGATTETTFHHANAINFYLLQFREAF